MPNPLRPLLSARSTYLLEAAAEALEDGRDPFARDFLIEHAVTLDECYGLSNLLAAAARTMLLLSHSAPEPGVKP